ncbi:hypothetical protein OROMI_033310 [Orobanche minor]
MDSGNVQHYSQSNLSDTVNNPHSFTTSAFQFEKSSSFINLEECQNGTSPPNLPQHRVFPYSPFSGHVLPHQHQQYGPKFSYQTLLNSPNVFYVGASLEGANSQASRVPKKKTKNSENPNPTNHRWTLAEDVALVKARLHVSCDADVGIGQKLEALWSRILQVWRQNMGNFDAARDSNSLECRWSRIQASVNMYHGIYERIERNPPSGTNEQIWKRDALRIYQDSNKNKPFKHLECWEICRKNVKWCTGLLTKQDSSKRQKLTANSSKVDSSTSKETQINSSEHIGSPSTPINLDADIKFVEAENAIPEVVTRPEGRKAIKDQKKRMAAENGVVDASAKLRSCLEKQVEFNNEDLNLKKTIFDAEIKLKERNQLMKEKAQKRRDQKRILLTNLSELAPSVRSAYEIMQANILKEWEKEGLLGQANGNDDNTGSS